MEQSTTDDAGHGREGALEALRHVAQEDDIARDFGAATQAFEPEDYEHIIAIAWRHQFNVDRSRFKREIRELQEHVSPKILSNLEASR